MPRSVHACNFEARCLQVQITDMESFGVHHSMKPFW
jgi:hypothetical protein